MIDACIKCLNSSTDFISRSTLFLKVRTLVTSSEPLQNDIFSFTAWLQPFSISGEIRWAEEKQRYFLTKTISSASTEMLFGGSSAGCKDTPENTTVCFSERREGHTHTHTLWSTGVMRGFAQEDKFVRQINTGKKRVCDTESLWVGGSGGKN